MSDSPNVALVKKHLAGFLDVDKFIEDFEETMAPNIRWTNTGFPDAKGIDAARATLKAWADGFGMGSIKIDYLNIAEDGNKVFTERMDYIRDKQGNDMIVAPTMGIFEIENGKIFEWRDYFDSHTMRVQG